MSPMNECRLPFSNYGSLSRNDIFETGATHLADCLKTNSTITTLEYDTRSVFLCLLSFCQCLPFYLSACLLSLSACRYCLFFSVYLSFLCLPCLYDSISLSLPVFPLSLSACLSLSLCLPVRPTLLECGDTYAVFLLTVIVSLLMRFFPRVRVLLQAVSRPTLRSSFSSNT